MRRYTYSEAIRTAIDESLAEQPNLVVLGQGLWSPFYVGQTMEGLEKKYTIDRVIDTPVSENAVTSMALGLALTGKRALVVHPCKVAIGPRTGSRITHHYPRNNQPWK
jgi:pyruvate/2-oxoglutarate/acetoin dehydrogenase E1 component